MTEVRLETFERLHAFTPARHVRARSVEDVVSAVRDVSNPSPVRARGAGFAMTACGMAEGGTVIDMTALDRIELQEDGTVVCGAGVEQQKLARHLAARGREITYIDLANATVGSLACFPSKQSAANGQWNSQVVGMRWVDAEGEVRESSDSDTLRLMRSSYGLLGTVVEVTLRTVPRRKTVFTYEIMHTREFLAREAALAKSHDAIFLYTFPELDIVVMELRSRAVDVDEAEPASLLSRLVLTLVRRDRAYNFGMVSRALIERLPFGRLASVRALEHFYLACLRITARAEALATYFDEVLARFPPKSTSFSNTRLNAWAVPASKITAWLSECYRYQIQHECVRGLPFTIYRIPQCRDALLSYAHREDMYLVDFTLTATTRGWEDVSRWMREMAERNGGVPLVNMTKGFSAQTFKDAYGEAEVELFKCERRRRDPRGRFLNPYFRELFE